MNKQIWLQDGNIFSKGSATTVSHSNGLPRGVYEVKVSQAGFYLYKVAETFVFDYKLYGLNESFINYVIKTYRNTTGNLGVLLDGIKGSGKSVTAKVLSNYLQLPVIIVRSMGEELDSKLIKFLATEIDFDCTFFFDEFEKEFGDSSLILSFMDGVYNSVYRKVFLLTTNKLDIEENLIGRPSRIRYKKSFGNLPESTTREILNDILEDKSAIESVIELAHSMQIVTIDLIKAIATEINIHGVEALNDIKSTFNIEFSKFSYSFKCLQLRAKASKFNFTVEEVNNIIQEYDKYTKLDQKSDRTQEELTFVHNFFAKYYLDVDHCTEDKELKHLKQGDSFNYEKVALVNVPNKWVLTIAEGGNIRINMIVSCYSCSIKGLNLLY